jgi:hypothetical protein
MIIWYKLHPFGIFCGHLVYFLPFWYTVPIQIRQPWHKGEHNLSINKGGGSDAYIHMYYVPTLVAPRLYIPNIYKCIYKCSESAGNCITALHMQKKVFTIFLLWPFHQKYIGAHAYIARVLISVVIIARKTSIPEVRTWLFVFRS